MRKNKIMGFIALLIMTLALVLMYLYLTYGQKVLSSETVLVANTDIEPGTLINTKLHFIEKSIDKNDLIPGSLTIEVSSIIEGMAANQYIPMNSQISVRCFEKPRMVVIDDKFVFKIPGSWIYAVPSSIRRGDDVLVYEIDARIDQEIKLSPANDESLPTYQAISGISLSSDTPVIETTVIYVKDSANREVVDVDGRRRLDGSSQVSSIEIVCTKKEMSQLEAKVLDGKKLILVYR